MSPDHIRSQSGGSLIEVVVCMLILAIGMISGLGMTQASQTGLDAGRRISTATGLAQAKMEEEVSMPYAQLSQESLEGRDDPDGFVRTWVIQTDAPRPHCVTIHVNVEWTDKTGRTHSLALVTLRSEGVVP